MTLALRMGRTLGELGRALSLSELRMWTEYDRLSPIGDNRGDIQTAQIVSALFQSQGGKVSLRDAVLRWGDGEPEDDGGVGLDEFLGKLAD